MGQSFPVVIDPQLEHLKLNDIVKAPIRGEIAKDFNVKTAIKNEPGLLSSTVNNLLLDDGDEEVHTYLCNRSFQKKFKQLLQPWRLNYMILALNELMKIFFGQIHSFSLFH